MAVMSMEDPGPGTREEHHLTSEPPGIRSERVYLVELIPTSKRLESPGEFAEILPRHLAWVEEKQLDGVIWATGPVVDEVSGENTGAGVFILRARNLAEVSEIVGRDPQVVGGFKRFRARPWLMRVAL
jgi:uncharacterized protein YciI